MPNSFIHGALQFLQQTVVYRPPQDYKPFILGEAGDDSQTQKTSKITPGHASLQELEAMLRFARRLANAMTDAGNALRVESAGRRLQEIAAQYAALAEQYEELQPVLLAYENSQGHPGNMAVSASVEENEHLIALLYHLPYNQDVILRRIYLPLEPPRKALMVYMEGISDKQVINRDILPSLLSAKAPDEELAGSGITEYLAERCLAANHVSKTVDMSAAQEAINSGDAVLFVEGADVALVIEAKGWEHRPVDRPVVEQSVRGAQEGFGEVLRVNTALIRKTLQNSDLVTEMVTVGTRSRIKCAVMYMESIANRKLVKEVKRRVRGVRTGYIGDAGVLEQFIEDKSSLLFPQTLSTERPDRVCAHLAEGRVAILTDGNPFVMIAPMNLFGLLHASEDYSIKPPYGTLLRLLRGFGALAVMLLPAFYLAISTFHPEAIPTDLLLAIAAARSQVPFSSLTGLILMDVAFELIREGGSRIPGILGPTIGIVGAIILGQAAVAAKIVSPILVIIVALTGLASFTIPDYRLAAIFRILRFLFIVAAAVMGLVGIATGFLLLVVMLSNIKSFGVPYLTPLAPRTASDLGDVILREAVESQEKRPDELNPRDLMRQPPSSKEWADQDPNREGPV